MWMDPRRTGIFLGQCAQYCGTQHAKMLLRVSVDSPENFAAWVHSQQLPAIQDDKVIGGKRVFETTGCINCHAISGTAATGRFGPDLTHLMSRQTIASGAADNTTDTGDRGSNQAAARSLGSGATAHRPVRSASSSE